MSENQETLAPAEVPAQAETTETAQAETTETATNPTPSREERIEHATRMISDSDLWITMAYKENGDQLAYLISDMRSPNLILMLISSDETFRNHVIGFLKQGGFLDPVPAQAPVPEVAESPEAPAEAPAQ